MAGAHGVSRGSVVGVTGRERIGGKGSLLDPGGLSNTGGGLLDGDMAVTLALALALALEPAVCLGAGAGMGSPEEVVRSLAMR